MKRLLSILLLAIMTVFAVCPMTAVFAEDIPEETQSYAETEADKAEAQTIEEASKNVLVDFINQRGVQFLYGLVLAVFSYIGLQCKALFEKYVKNKEIKNIIRTCVRAGEQIYKDLHGEEKYTEILKNASQMLTDKGITVTDLELRMLIEDAVGEFNDAFNKPAVKIE